MPEPFGRVTGIIASLPAANIDTDVIMPKIFLKGIDRSGLARGLFHDLRFASDGTIRPDFVLNRTPWQASSFLVAGTNFGCGSSREHAVWGLRQFGIRAVLAPSFAGIFFDNCARNGLLALEVSDDVIRILTEYAGQGKSITVDLPAERIETPAGTIPFQIGQRRKYMIQNGLDAIGMTLEWRHAIEAFQRQHLEAHPWLA